MKYEFVHASGDTFMSLTKTREDMKNLLALRAICYTITECAESVTFAVVKAVAKKYGYEAVNPDAGDIAFMVHPDATILGHGGPLAIPALHKAASLGGHGPRHNSWVKLRYEGEIITHNGVHLVTEHTLHGDHGPGQFRTDEQVKQMQLLGEQMRKFGSGTDLAVGSGDLNASLPAREDLKRVMDRYGLTTTAEETGVMTGTHGRARIDYAWTYDKDKRVKVESMKVLKSAEFNSDHDPIKVTLHIRDRGSSVR